MRLVFLDTETTGLSARRLANYASHRDRLHRDARTGGCRATTCTTTSTRGGRATRTRCAVHGLTDEFLADKPLLAHAIVRRPAGVPEAAPRSSSTTPHSTLGVPQRRNLRLGPRSTIPLWPTSHRACTDSLHDGARALPAARRTRSMRCAGGSRSTTATRALHGALLDAGLLAEVYIHDDPRSGVACSSSTRATTVQGHADPRRRRSTSVGLRPAGAPREPTLTRSSPTTPLLAELDKAGGGRTAVAVMPRHGIISSDTPGGRSSESVLRRSTDPGG